MSVDRPAEGHTPHAPVAASPLRSLAPWLEVRTGTRRGVLSVSVLGEIDLANHQTLQQLLASLDLSGVPRIELDLSGLSFSDSRGACHLLDFMQLAREHGSVVNVVDAQPAVTRLLDLLMHLPQTA
jgi:anti-anti-sigma factor